MKPAHVYRRRRIGAVLLASVVALYSGTWADAEEPPVTHTVVPDDTLWSIVIDYYPPSEDPRVEIEAVREANGLEDYRVQPGMRLELPPLET